MSLWTLLLVYVIGGVTFIPILVVAAFAALLYLSPPVGDADPSKLSKGALNSTAAEPEKEKLLQPATGSSPSKPLQGWVVVRRTFEEPPMDNASYVGNLMRSFLDSRQQSTSTSSSTASAGGSSRRPRDTFYALLKGTVLYLYEDEACTECYAALQVAAYDVGIWPDPRNMTDAELFAKRNAIRLKAKESTTPPNGMNVVSKDMKLGEGGEKAASSSSREPSPAGRSLTDEHYMFVKCNSDMEDWYMALVHASTASSASSSSSTPSSLLPDPLVPLEPIFSTDDMAHLVKTLDQQPDPIPMRWLNALVGRIFYSLYRTSGLEANLIARLMKKITKVPRPAFLTELVVREVNVGNTAPLLSKPMLKELTKEGDASVEMGLNYHSQEGEHSGIRITVEATVTINIKESLPLNLGNRFDLKPKVVKLVLAVILRSMEGNILVRIKRPPSNRIWWGFTSMPKMEIELLPIVSDRKIKWGLVLKPIESLLREVIQDSVVLPNMDDIPFFDTEQYGIRGGIFPDAVRTVYDFSSPSAAATETTVTTEDGSQITTVSPNTVIPTSVNLELKKEKGATAEDEMGFAESMSLPGELKIIEEQEVTVGRTDTTVSAPVMGAVSSSPKRSWFPRFGGGNVTATRPTPPAPSPQPTITETPPPEKEEDVKEVPATDPPTPKPEEEPALPSEQPSPPVSKVEVKDDDAVAEPKEATKEEAQSEAPAPETDEKPSSSTDALEPPTTPIPIRRRSPTLTHQSTRSAAGDFFSPPKSSLLANGQSSPSPLSKAEVPKEDTTVTMAGITPTTATQPSAAPRGILDALRAQAADAGSSDSSPASSTPNNRSSATQTLITAWKNREANKQVLAATARDAIKKWGFNLKKDAVPTANGGPAEVAQPANGSAAAQAGAEGSSTAGSTRPATPDSRNKTYEQMRAEAAERRHRDPSPQPDAGEFGERARTISSSGTAPGALNASPYRPPSPKPTTQLNTLSRAPTSPNAQHLRPDPAAFLSAEQPLDAEERMRRLSSGSGPHPGPVMRQPGQAAMMRIPGIHASHKGDVMAIGSSPTPPPPVPEEPGEGPLVAKTLGPKTAAAVQTVYRLFQKNNAPGATEGSTATPADSHTEQAQDAPASTLNPKPEAAEVHEPEPHPEVDNPTDASPPEAPAVTALGTPPPLPPRRSPSPKHEKRDSASSASSFLKQIQAKDASRSSSVGGSRPSSRRTSLMEPQKGGPDDPFTAAPSESNMATPASTEVAS